MQAPPGYVPGVGRGATGFTTRSDIGPARESTDAPEDRNRAAKRGAENEDAEAENLNENNYDEFNGYGGSLFSKGVYEKDDEEADKVYWAIDQRQDERRKVQRERREQEQLEKFRRERPKIQQQFADLKLKLAEVSTEEWDNLPEVADITRRVKKRRPDRMTDAPDSFLTSRIGGMVSDINPTSGLATAFPGTQTAFPGMQTAFPGSGMQTAFGGTQTAMPGYTGAMDLRQIGHARNTMMGVKLDQVGQKKRQTKQQCAGRCGGRMA